MKDNVHPLDAALSFCIKGHPEISEEILRGFPEQDDARVVFNLGWHEMRHGNLNKGLSMLDAGRYLNVFGLPRIAGEIWKDQSLAGKTLLFRCENGFGDQIMNFRFAKDFADKGANVVVSCSPELMPLFSRHGFVCVANAAVAHVHYDYWVPSMSAAHVLGYDTENFPGEPFLTAESTPLFAKKDTLKVGIRWAGNPQFEHQQHRRFDPEPLFALHELSGVSLYSLQRDEGTVDNLPFADLRNQLYSWESTASIIQDLDLVITSCTSIAHLSAALGKETWVIVPIMPYYAWAAPGETSVWYDSVKLFRQEVYGNWDAPLTKVREALEDRLRQGRKTV
jgi:hypothetical protein